MRYASCTFCGAAYYFVPDVCPPLCTPSIPRDPTATPFFPTGILIMPFTAATPLLLEFEVQKVEIARGPKAQL